MKMATILLLGAIGARILLEVNKRDAAADLEGLPFFGGAIAEGVIDAETEALRNGLDFAIVGAGLLWVL